MKKLLIVGGNGYLGNKLKNYLEREGIRTLIQWNGKAVHQIKSLKLKADVPNTVHFFKRCIMLPIHTFLKETPNNLLETEELKEKSFKKKDVKALEDISEINELISL